MFSTNPAADHRPGRAVAAIVCLAFLARLAAGLLKGPHAASAGYSFYGDIARTFLSGGGLCFAPGEGCAVRMPVYPLLVAPFIAAGGEFPWLVVVQALLGSSVVLLTAVLAGRLFDSRVGLAAALFAAFNPYTVVHDVAFQETALLNALTLLAVVLLVQTQKVQSVRLGFAAGVVLALAILTTARIVPLAAVAILWLAFGDGLRNQQRQRLALVAALPIVIMVGAWVARNARVVGTPVLTTESGLSLWIAHSPAMMTIYPRRSVDEVEDVARQYLRADGRARLGAAAGDPVREDRVYAQLAWSAIREHPARAASNALVRVLLAFSGQLSPAREWPIQLGYAVLFVPLNLLAAVGLARAIRADRAHALALLIFASVALTAAVFWAHTSHRSYLHPFKALYAASLIIPSCRTGVSRRAAAPTSARDRLRA